MAYYIVSHDSNRNTQKTPQKWLSNSCMSRTYGYATTISFLLSSSTSKADKEALPPLTKFPTTNSNEPNLVLANRKRPLCRRARSAESSWK